MDLIGLANLFYIMSLIILMAMVGSAVGLAAWLILCYIVNFFSKRKKNNNGRKNK